MNEYYVAVIGITLIGYGLHIFLLMFEELYDRYIRNKKVCRMELDVSDYVELKSIVKHGDTGLSVDKWLQFHFKENVKDYLERN